MKLSESFEEAETLEVTPDLLNEDQRYRRPKHRYGNFKVLHDSSLCLLNLGPDYWCFLPTFFFFCLGSFFLTRLVFNSSQNIILRICTCLVCWGECIAYLAVALSNPGVALDPAETGQVIANGRQCRKCGFQVPRKTSHCSDCGICILGHDHHCPWTSKCIGGNNIGRFYIFLGLTPVYLVYMMVAFVVLASQNLEVASRHP